jgi:glycerol-3-phosphate dehydrogenase
VDGEPAATAPEAGGGHLRLIKGSHIVVKRIFEHDNAYIFQHPDGRIVFAIPYERDFTLIGTTDLDYHGDANAVAISEDEIATVRAGQRVFRSRSRRPTWCGPIRACARWWKTAPTPRPSRATTGWKWTRRAAAAERLWRQDHHLPQAGGGSGGPDRQGAGQPPRPWTHNACLPGGDLFGAEPQNRSVLEFGKWQEAQQARYSGLPLALVARYCRAYGTRIHTLLADRTDVSRRSATKSPRPVRSGSGIPAPL